MFYVGLRFSYSAPSKGTVYYDQRVCLSVCLSASISLELHVQSSPFARYVWLCLVLLWRQYYAFPVLLMTWTRWPEKWVHVGLHVSDAKRVSLDKDLTSRRIPKLTYHLQPARATKLATDRSIFIRVLDKKKTLSKYFNRLTVYYFHFKVSLNYLVQIYFQLKSLNSWDDRRVHSVIDNDASRQAA